MYFADELSPDTRCRENSEDSSLVDSAFARRQVVHRARFSTAVFTLSRAYRDEFRTSVQGTFFPFPKGREGCA